MNYAKKMDARVDEPELDDVPVKMTRDQRRHAYRHVHGHGSF